MYESDIDVNTLIIVWFTFYHKIGVLPWTAPTPENSQEREGGGGGRDGRRRQHVSLLELQRRKKFPIIEPPTPKNSQDKGKER